MSPLENLMKDMAYTQHRNIPNPLHKIKRVHGYPKPNHRAQFTNFCSEVSGWGDWQILSPKSSMHTREAKVEDTRVASPCQTACQ